MSQITLPSWENLSEIVTTAEEKSIHFLSHIIPHLVLEKFLILLGVQTGFSFGPDF